MKAYIASVDWADEGDVFFFSVESDERLQAMKELLDVYSKLELIEPQEIYWGTNECFEFGIGDYVDFVNEAKDISDEELAVFKKFKVKGFDIYEIILDTLLSPFAFNWRVDRYVIPEYITQEDLDEIKPAYLKLFGLKNWEKIQKGFDEKTKI